MVLKAAGDPCFFTSPFVYSRSGHLSGYAADVHNRAQRALLHVLLVARIPYPWSGNRCKAMNPPKYAQKNWFVTEAGRSNRVVLKSSASSAGGSITASVTSSILSFPGIFFESSIVSIRLPVAPHNLKHTISL